MPVVHVTSVSVSLSKTEESTFVMTQCNRLFVLVK